MTKDEWDKSWHIERLLAAAKLSKRKELLFTIACCNRVKHLITYELAQVIDIIELYADGKITKEETQSARTVAVEAFETAVDNPDYRIDYAITAIYWLTCWNQPSWFYHSIQHTIGANGEEQHKWVCNLLRHMARPL